MAIKVTIEEFLNWVSDDLARNGRNGVELVEKSTDDDGHRTVRIHIYTENNSYSIHAREATEHHKGYLSCGATARRERAGETWKRGSDLADGPLDVRTWHRILGDIVSYEMVKVHMNRFEFNPDAPRASVLGTVDETPPTEDHPGIAQQAPEEAA